MPACRTCRSVRLSGVSRTIKPEVVAELLRQFPPIARLLPQHRRMGGAIEPPDDRLDRIELFDAVLGALTELARERWVTLVIEDVHWAEQSTRDLLGFLLARIVDERVALVVSYRSDDLHRRHPLRRTVAEWARLPTVDRLPLSPLPAEGDPRAGAGAQPRADQ